MKIESHNITMASKNVAYKTMQSSTLSFESYISDPETQKNIDRFECSKDRTLSQMISDLISMLQSRISQKPVDEEHVVGYTHCSLQEKYEEFESLAFSTKGCIKTDKGEMSIDLNFSMSRSFVVENRIDIYTPFDPLVINLDGELPELENTTFSFDIDNNGVEDQLADLGGRSGFLALDKNGDGAINQGSELFGTLSGDGFGELSEYDKDSNGWIDENDSIFDKLRIWLKDEQSGQRELVALGDAGVGAIYLGNTQSDFTYKTQSNDILG